MTQALQAAEQIGNEKYRAETLAQLAPWLRGKVKESALNQALQAAVQIGAEESRDQVLRQLAPQLRGKARKDALAQSLQAAVQIGDEEHRAQVLGQLTRQLRGKAREDALAQALQAAEQIGNEEHQAQVLLRLLPLMADPNPARRLLQQAILAHIWKLQDQKREALLGFLAIKGLFTADNLGLPTPAIKAVAQHVIEICQEWRWQ